MVDFVTIGILLVAISAIQISMYYILVYQINRRLGPVVSKAFGILGTKSSDTRQLKAVKGDLMESIIDSPRFTAVKIGAEAMGIDIDDMFERHGPEKTLLGIFEILQSFGINPLQLISGGLTEGLSGSTPQSSGENPYLRRP